MYTSELLKISEAYTKQMYKAKVTESSVVESTQHVTECGKQCNESYEEFYVKLEKEPFNILKDDCWQCDELLTLVRNNDKEEEFNNLAKETFMDNALTLTEFNDWCRFDYDSICEYLGLSDDEEDEDEEDEDDEYDDDDINETANNEVLPKGDTSANSDYVKNLSALMSGEINTPQFLNNLVPQPKGETPPKRVGPIRDNVPQQPQ